MKTEILVYRAPQSVSLRLTAHFPLNVSGEEFPVSTFLPSNIPFRVFAHEEHTLKVFVVRLDRISCPT
jgi:hypothetical protein